MELLTFQEFADLAGISPKTCDFTRTMVVRTLPRDPRGEGGAKNKIKNPFKHSQE